MNTRHPVNPALKEEGRARTAHGLGEGLLMPVSPAWPVAAQRIQEREMVGGEQWRAGNGPPGGKAQRSQQSLGRTSGLTEEPVERHPEEAPSRSPHPRRCPQAGQGAGSHPLPSLQAGLGNTLLVSLE